MFSKALFKQTAKAHWVRWMAVTVSTCVMLAIVIVVLGNLGINDIRDSLKNVFIQADQQSELKEKSIDSYELYLTTTDTYNQMSMLQSVIENSVTDFKTQFATLEDKTEENAKFLALSVATEKVNSSFFANLMTEEQKASAISFISATLLYSLQEPEMSAMELVKETYGEMVYTAAYDEALSDGYNDEEALSQADGAKELAFIAIDSYVTKSSSGSFIYNLDNFKDEARVEVNNMMFNNVEESQLKSGVSEDEALQNAVAIKIISNTAITTYQALLIDENFKNSLNITETDADKIQEIVISSARDEACKSISDQIPDKVSEALTELGNMDMYSLIIGSIFYRIAGLLLPMVFVIMTANNLLAGQVDSGSMAYVLSTPTKRRTVTVTQMAYLIFALFSMYALLTVVSVISVWISGGNSFAINYGEILLLNLGAFLTMFAFAGFCFMCSAIFNRSKHSLSIGGGLTIFSLVCTILGLFGSAVVPSAMRINAMDFFNYLSIITLFDTASILSGGLNFIWQFGILFGIGIVTIVIGILRFDKKDLPL